MAKTGVESGEASRLSSAEACAFTAQLFQAFGIGEKTARDVADGLVEADLAGVGSHGLLQAPNYLRRIAAGTISRAEDISLVHESGAVAVYDAGLMLGHPAAARAMDAAIGRAGRFGIAAVAVRSATHFGVAGRHAQRAADAGMIGIVMCNTRPMMPAPGAREPAVGTNPLAIALPAKGKGAVVFDMAMSEVAMGKIRAAAANGEPIPRGWALDAQGWQTTDPAAAIGGMLLPAAGAKGFGLAFMIDLLCGLLSGGSYCEGLASMFSAPGASGGLLLAADRHRSRPFRPFARLHRCRRGGGGKAARRETPGRSRPAVRARRSQAPGQREGRRHDCARACRCVGAQPYRIRSGY